VQVHEVLDALAEPLPLLADRGEVHVVLERDLRAQLLLHELDQPLTSPPGQRICECDLTAFLLEHAGAPDRRERHLPPLDPRVGRQCVRDGTDLRDERVRALHACPFVTAGHELAGHVGDRSSHPVPADVDPDHPSGLGIQLVQHGGRALPSAGAPGLADQAGIEQRRERLRDRGFRQRRLAGDLRA